MFNDPIVLFGIPILVVWGIICIFFRGAVWRMWVWTNTAGNPKPEPMTRTKGFDRLVLIYGLFSLATVGVLLAAVLGGR